MNTINTLKTKRLKSSSWKVSMMLEILRPSAKQKYVKYWRFNFDTNIINTLSEMCHFSVSIPGAVSNLTIGVNLGVFHTILVVCRYKHAALTGLRRWRRHISINIVKKSAETPKQKPQANKPYGTKEWRFLPHFLPDTWGVLISKLCISRKNTSIFLKLTLMVRFHED